MNKDVIVALDFHNREETIQFLNKFSNNLYVKVGMELFYKEGNDIIKEIKALGHKIFLDLKLHDIPTTVYKAMKSISKLDIDMVNVHALGGKEMMNKALQGLTEGSEIINKVRPTCIAVTLLTSMSSLVTENELLIKEDINKTIMHYAKNTKESGLDGVVCSPLESSLIHNNLGNDFLTVTPGIRLESDNKNDQVRISTPMLAKELGSNYIVVGRTITNSIDPVSTYNLVKKQFME